MRVGPAQEPGSQDTGSSGRWVNGCLAVAGLILISAGALGDDYGIAEGLKPGSDPSELDVIARSIRTLQIAMLAVGAVLIRFRVLVASRAYRFLFVRPNLRLVAALAPLLLINALFWCYACWRGGLPLVSVMSCCALAQKLALNGLVVLLTSAVAVNLFHWRYAPLLVSAAWAITLPTEVVCYYYANTRFEAQYLDMATPYSIQNLMTGTVVAVWCIAALACLSTGGLLIKNLADRSWPRVFRVAALWIAVLLLNVPNAARLIVDASSGFSQLWVNNHYDACFRYL